MNTPITWWWLMTAGLCSQKTQNAAYFSGSSDTEKARDVAVQPRAVDVDAVAADHAAFLHAADALGDGGRRQPHLVADVAQGAAAVRLQDIEDLIIRFDP